MTIDISSTEKGTPTSLLGSVPCIEPSGVTIVPVMCLFGFNTNLYYLDGQPVSRGVITGVQAGHTYKFYVHGSRVLIESPRLFDYETDLICKYMCIYLNSLPSKADHMSGFKASVTSTKHLCLDSFYIDSSNLPRFISMVSFVEGTITDCTNDITSILDTLHSCVESMNLIMTDYYAGIDEVADARDLVDVLRISISDLVSQTALAAKRSMSVSKEIELNAAKEHIRRLTRELTSFSAELGEDVNTAAVYVERSVEKFSELSHNLPALKPLEIQRDGSIVLRLGRETVSISSTGTLCMSDELRQFVESSQ